MTMTVDAPLIGSSDSNVSAMVRLLRTLREQQDEAARKSSAPVESAPIIKSEPVPDLAPPGDESARAASTTAQEPAPSRDVVSFAPSGQDDLAPSGLRAKANANLAALRTLHALDVEHRTANAEELAVLARWAGWGALPNVFDESNTEWAGVRESARAFLDQDAWAEAMLTTINAHYTSAEIVKAMWEAVQDLGFSGGRVLEPGCGSGNFIGLAPDLPLDFFGVELDPTTARIAQALYPHATIRTEGFENSRFPEGYFDLAIGNVPFGTQHPYDPVYNRGNRTIHNYCIIKALSLTRPGGLVALITSRWTMDAKDAGARFEIAQLGDLIGAVRLPSSSMRASSGTDVVVDILLLRRRSGDTSYAPAWRNVTPVETPDGPVEINEYFVTRPHLVLGTLGAKNGQYHEHDMVVKANSVLSESLPRALRSLRVQVIDFRTPATDVVACQSCGHASGACSCFIEVPNPLPDDVPTADELFVPTDVTAIARAQSKAQCPECDRVFDLTNEDYAGEFYYGHDCEAPEVAPKTKRRRLAALPEPLPVAKDLSHLHQEGSILRSARGFVRLTDGVTVTFEPTSRKDVPELGVLIDLRDTVLRVLDAQAHSTDDAKFLGIQADLNARYDAYVSRFGPLNRFTLAATGKVDHACVKCGHEWDASSRETPTTCPECFADHEDVGIPRTRRNYPRMGGFRLDPAFYTVMALEIFDPESQMAYKADVFSKRVVAPRETRGSAESAQDAIAICLDEYGRIDVDVIARLLKVDTDDALAQMGSLVWLDPETDSLVPAATYLSGNVRQKLARAKRAARLDEKFAANVAALTAVQPVELGPKEIDARPGAPWIPVDDVEKFCLEVLYVDRVGSWIDLNIEYVPITATWEISSPDYHRRGVAMTSTWGTQRADAIDLFRWSLNQKPAAVFDTVQTADGDKRVLNVEETFLAREKQELLANRFREWIWEDPERSERTARVYNDLFNSWVVPEYDGSHLTTPGRALSFTPHPHQLDGTWRVLQSPTTLLAHAVGGGKTAIIGMSAMEQRRLGLIKKPCVAVPNHMLGQVANELLQLYPLAKILIPTEADMSKDGRKGFVARCAMGDWDMVLLTHSAFGKIGVSPEIQERFLARKVAAFEDAIYESRQGKGLSVKKLTQAKLRLEQRQKRLLNAIEKDDGVTFDATGIDYLYVDEAQEMKNLAVMTHMRGVTADGSQRAADLEMKLTYLRERVGERVATFSTATPIANSVAEMFVVQTYLALGALRESEVQHFDAWAATFGSTVTALELAPDGGSYRMNSRFARFHNVPELITAFRMFADVRTMDDLNIPGIPEIAGDKPQNVIIEPSPNLVEYVEDLVERARLIRNKSPRVIGEKVTKEGDTVDVLDNMLVVCGDGRKAALDLRLVGLRPDPNGGKVAAAADRIIKHWEENKDRVYKEPNGLDSPRKGAFQLVFCDMGTPKEHRWSVYADLKETLVERGMPDDAVRFIHEAKNAQQKAQIFAACREGRVAVLIGSTQKMGIGTNVQTRLVAMHHLDCPWRPDQISQRDGRGIRQKNQNKEVSIYRYATEKSFDIYLWQTVERKAAFIYQVMRGQITARDIDDMGEEALSYAEIKALATGNPLIMEKAGVDNDVARLKRLRRAHEDDQRRLEWKLREAEQQVPILERHLRDLERAAAIRKPVAGDAFSITVGDDVYEKRTEGGDALVLAIEEVIGQGAMGVAKQVGEYAGFPIDVIVERKYEHVRVTIALRESPLSKEYTRIEFRQTSGMGLLSTLSNLVHSLDDKLERTTQRIPLVQQEAEAARARIGLPFDEEERFVRLTQRQAEIDAVLADMEDKAA